MINPLMLQMLTAGRGSGLTRGLPGGGGLLGSLGGGLGGNVQALLGQSPLYPALPMHGGGGKGGAHLTPLPGRGMDGGQQQFPGSAPMMGGGKAGLAQMLRPNPMQGFGRAGPLPAFSPFMPYRQLFAPGAGSGGGYVPGPFGGLPAPPAPPPAGGGGGGAGSGGNQGHGGEPTNDGRPGSSGGGSGSNLGGDRGEGLRSRARGGDGGGSGGSGGGSGGGGSCFERGTPVMMEDGSTKPIEELERGDRLFNGGRVTAKMEFDGSEAFDYNGTIVSGSHAVFERGKWVQVQDSADALPAFKKVDTWYVVASEHHEIWIKGQRFADYLQLDDNHPCSQEQWERFIRAMNEAETAPA